MHLQIKVRRPRMFVEDDERPNALIDDGLDAVQAFIDQYRPTEDGHHVFLDGFTAEQYGEGLRALPTLIEHDGSQILDDQDVVVDDAIKYINDNRGDRLTAERGDAHVERIADLSELQAALKKYTDEAPGAPYRIESVLILSARENEQIRVSVGLDKKWEGPED